MRKKLFVSTLTATALAVIGFTQPASAAIGDMTVYHVTDAVDSVTQGRGVTSVAAATDGKVWFVGVGTNYGTAPFFGYMNPVTEQTQSGTTTVYIPVACSGDVVPITGNQTPVVFAFSNDTVLAVFDNKLVRLGPTCGDMTLVSDQMSYDAFTSAAMDGQGNVWFAPMSGQVRIVHADLTVEQKNLPYNTLRGIALGSDGRMWVTAYETNGHYGIAAIPATGSDAPEFFTTDNGTGCGPYGITSATDGNLYFTCNTYDQVGQITTSGVITYDSVPTWGPVGIPGIVQATDGNLYFTDLGDSYLRKIDPSSWQHYVGDPYTNLSPSNGWGANAAHPGSIIDDGNGNVWFTDGANGSLIRLEVDVPMKEDKPSVAPDKCKKVSTTILFGWNSAKLTSTTRAQLKCIYAKYHAKKKLTLHGYTQTNFTSKASKAANLKLAAKRSAVVKAYLVGLGFKGKVTIVSVGASHPASKKQQKLNRRVVLTFGLRSAM